MLLDVAGSQLVCWLCIDEIIDPGLYSPSRASHCDDHVAGGRIAFLVSSAPAVRDKLGMEPQQQQKKKDRERNMPENPKVSILSA